MLGRLSRWCYQRRRRVVALWILGFLVLNVVSGTVGSAYDDSSSGGHSDSGAAFSLLRSRFPARAGDTADIVFRADRGVRDPGVQAQMQAMFAKVGPGRLEHVVAVDSPYDVPGRVSADGKVAYATFTFDQRANDLPAMAAKPILDATKGADEAGLQVEAGGKMIARALQSSPQGSELIGLAAATIILFLTFGSLLAMSLPILAALFGVGISAVFVVLLSHVMAVPPWAPSLALMIGLGVGIDYALFIVVRYRGGLHDGLDPEEATVVALTSAGRAVLFAGCTVIVSLLGMFAMGISFIYGLALAGVAAVLTTMLASLTLVPAVMGFAGAKLANNKGEKRHHRDSLAFRWSRQVQRRPGTMAAVSLGVLLLLALPVFSIRLGVSDQGNDPASWTTRRAYDLLASGFGQGFNGPMLLAADLSDDRSDAQGRHRDRLADVTAFAGDLQRDPDVAFVAPPQPNAAGDAAVVFVIPKGAPQDRSTEQLVHHLRAEIRDRRLAIHVGSVTAVGIDSADEAGARLPYMIVAVLLLSFLLLMTVFRSVLVAVKAAVMNLLSIGAAYGVIVAIFQWGWLRDIVGIGRPGPIDFWAPMMLFTVLFGLSMDYEVFLLSRVREEYLLTRDNSAAVADGLAATARVITAAAAIMIAVFLSFAFGDVRALKLMGLGLATAVFVDATIVRMVLVPATMELLGKANWWLPSSVDRVLPRIGIEAPPEPEAPNPDRGATSHEPDLIAR